MRLITIKLLVIVLMVIERIKWSKICLSIESSEFLQSQLSLKTSKNCKSQKFNVWNNLSFQALKLVVYFS